MNWNDAARATVITIAVMIANGLLFLFNRWLFNSYRITETGYEYGYVAVATLPALMAGLALLIAGFRSGLWWWLFAPGILLWALRPLKAQAGWELDWVFDELVDYLTWVIFHFDRTPGYAFATLNSSVVIAMLAAIITGQSIRLTRKALRRQLRDGNLRGAGGGSGSASDRGGTAQLPKARWASRSEVRARFSHPGGIVLGEMTDPLRDTPDFKPGGKRKWRDKQGRGDLITMNPEDGNGHVLVMSQAGHFKTTGIAISNILHYNGPLIVYDPKCELYARTKQARIDKGFNPVVIDATHGFDPAKLIALLAEDHPSAWLRMAKLMIPKGYGGIENGQYFKDAATALFTALLAYYAEVGSKNIIGNVAKILSLPADKVHTAVKNTLGTTRYAFVANRLKDLEGMESRFWHSVKTEITNNLLFAEFPDIQRYWSMDPDSPVLAKLVDPKTDIYLNIPQHVAEDFAPMLRLMLGSILVATQLVEVNEAPRDRRLILIDEASRLGNMDILENIRDRGRSIGLHLMMIYQDAGQVEKIWGVAGQRSWRNGCAAMIGGPVSDPKSAQDLSTMLGSRTVRVTTEGSSTQAPVMSGALGGSVSSSETEQVRDIPLISPTLISQLPGHAAIIVSPGNKPILGTKAIWFTRNDMKDKVRTTDEIREELDVFETQKKLIKRLQDVAKKGENGENAETGDTTAETGPEYPENNTTPAETERSSEPESGPDLSNDQRDSAPTQQTGSDTDTASDPDACGTDPVITDENYEPNLPDAQPKSVQQAEASTAPDPDEVFQDSEMDPFGLDDATDAGFEETFPATRAEEHAGAPDRPPYPQMTLPLSGPADAITTTEPQTESDPEAQIEPYGTGVQPDQPDEDAADPLTRNGITCDESDGRRITPDPQMLAAFTEWASRETHGGHPAETRGSDAPLPARETGSRTQPDQEPEKSCSDPEPEEPDTGKNSAGSGTVEPGSEDTAEQASDQASEAAGSDAEPDNDAAGNETGSEGGEDGDEAGTTENGQDNQARRTAAVEPQEATEIPRTAQGDQAAPQGPDLPGPAASLRIAQVEDPSAAPAWDVKALSGSSDPALDPDVSGKGRDETWREPPAFWGELGVPWEQLDFGRKPPLDPARLPRWLRPLWNATGPLRRLWVRVMLPTGDIPLNMRPYTMEIIPRPHDATEGSWLIRKWDVLDWYLNHPGDRYATYDHKLRQRRQSVLRWRLPAWLLGRAPGKPPWIGPPCE